MQNVISLTNIKALIFMYACMQDSEASVYGSIQTSNHNEQMKQIEGRENFNANY